MIHTGDAGYRQKKYRIFRRHMIHTGVAGYKKEKYRIHSVNIQ